MKSLRKVGFCALLSCLFALASAQELRIAERAEDTKPLQAGDAAPSFTVYEVDGSPFTFDPANLARPAMIITFRGGWCPYCNTHLQELRHVLPEIKRGGMDVLFLSGDRPELLYSSLKAEAQQDIAGLDYQILSDAGMAAASALGIAFKVPADMAENFRQRGRDIGSSSIEMHQALSVPAVFVIDADGVITFSYANPDYKVRLAAEELRAAAAPLLTRP